MSVPWTEAPGRLERPGRVECVDKYFLNYGLYFQPGALVSLSTEWENEIGLKKPPNMYHC